MHDNLKKSLNTEVEKEKKPVLTEPEFINYSLWAEFQEGLSSYLGISLGLFDSYGDAVISPSGNSKICEILNETDKGNALYRDAYARAIARAMHLEDPLHYKCFTGESIFVIPVRFNPDFILFIVGGHVYLNDNEALEFVHLSEEQKIAPSILNEFGWDIRKVLPSVFSSSIRHVQKLAVPFLKNLYLKGYYEKEYQQVKVLMQVSTPTGFLKSRDELYQNVFNALGVLFDINSASVLERSANDSFRTISAFGLDRAILSEWELDKSSDIVNRIVSSKKLQKVDNRHELVKLGLSGRITSVHPFPLIVDNELIGLLSIFNTKITEESARLITLLVTQLSLVIKSLKRGPAAERKLRNFDSIKDIHQQLAPILNPDDLFDAIMEKSTEIVGAEQGSLMVINQDEKTLYVKASKGLDKNILQDVRVRMGEGISGRVAERGCPIIVGDIEKEILKRRGRPRYKTKSFLSIPLMIESRIIGVINVTDKITGEIFSESDLELLQSFACYASIVLDRGAYVKKTEELQKISNTDPLTGVLNKRCFQERLLENEERSKRYNEPFTVFMIDVDNFKDFNDKYGHLGGDEALKRVAWTVKDALRTVDIVARTGGEEFCVILPNTKKEDAFVIAERMRKDVEMIRFVGGKVPVGSHISISVGISEYPSDGISAEEIVHRADMAMYSAKDEGKNRVVISA